MQKNKLRNSPFPQLTCFHASITDYSYSSWKIKVKMPIFTRGTMNWDNKRLKIPENTANLTANIHLYSWGWLYRRGLTKAFLEMGFQCRFVVMWVTKSFLEMGFQRRFVGVWSCGQHRHSSSSDSAPALPLTLGKPKSPAAHPDCIKCCLQEGPVAFLCRRLMCLRFSQMRAVEILKIHIIIQIGYKIF